jgi:MFS family permease
MLALGGTEVTVGLVSALGSVAQFITQPIGGYLADSTSDRVKIIQWGTTTLALSYLFYLFAPDATTILIGAFIINLNFLHSTSLSSLMADSLTSKQRSTGYSFVLAVQRGTPLIVTVLGGFIIESFGLDFGMRLSLSLTIVMGLIVAYIRGKFLKEIPHLRKNETSIAFSLGKIPLVVTTAYKEMYLTLRNLPRNLKAIAVISLLGYITTTIVGPFWIVYATNVIGVKPTEWGLAMTLSGVTTVIASFLAGQFIDKIGRRRTLLSGLFLMPFLIVSFLFCTTSLHVTLFWMLISTILCFLTPAFQAIFMDITSPETRGRVISALGMNPFWVQPRAGIMVGIGFLAYIPTAVAGLMSGYLYEINNLLPWLLLAASYFGIFLLSLLFVHEPEKV